MIRLCFLNKHEKYLSLLLTYFFTSHSRHYFFICVLPYFNTENRPVREIKPRRRYEMESADWILPNCNLFRMVNISRT